MPVKVLGVIAAAVLVVVGVIVVGLGFALAPGDEGSCSSETYGRIQLGIALVVGTAWVTSAALLVRQLAYGRGTQSVALAVALSVGLLVV
jgi:hypothetical protein